MTPDAFSLWPFVQFILLVAVAIVFMWLLMGILERG
jgi:hypothetical protein